MDGDELVYEIIMELDLEQVTFKSLPVEMQTYIKGDSNPLDDPKEIWYRVGQLVCKSTVVSDEEERALESVGEEYGKLVFYVYPGPHDYYVAQVPHLLTIRRQAGDSIAGFVDSKFFIKADASHKRTRIVDDCNVYMEYEHKHIQMLNKVGEKKRLLDI